MSDVQPYVDPNGPDFYAPPELRERATREQPGVTPEPAAEWRPRLSEGPPLQPLDKPQRRDEVFTKAVAQALQEAMESVEAPSVLRGTSGQRALFSLVARFSIAVAIAASIALVLVMVIPASQSPVVQSSEVQSPEVQSNDIASISSIWAAQEWLDQHSGQTSDARQKFDQFMAAQARDTGRQDARKPERDDALYQQFLKWQKSTDANR